MKLRLRLIAGAIALASPVVAAGTGLVFLQQAGGAVRAAEPMITDVPEFTTGKEIVADPVTGQRYVKDSRARMIPSAPPPVEEVAPPPVEQRVVSVDPVDVPAPAEPEVRRRAGLFPVVPLLLGGLAGAGLGVIALTDGDDPVSP